MYFQALKASGKPSPGEGTSSSHAHLPSTTSAAASLYRWDLKHGAGGKDGSPAQPAPPRSPRQISQGNPSAKEPPPTDHGHDSATGI